MYSQYGVDSPDHGAKAKKVKNFDDLLIHSIQSIINLKDWKNRGLGND